jgi:sugar-specific transcriptional regulator TrmB
METKILEEVGFTKGEIKVYFALLEFGESTIGPLSRKAEVTPAKTYPILDKLAKKGLITSVIKSDTKYFQAFNPNRISDFLKEKKKVIEQQEREIKKLIPKIVSKQKQEAQQSATVYESFNGMKTLYNEIIDYLYKTKQDFIGFTLGEEEYKFKESEYFFQQYDNKRRELHIKTKLIGHNSQKGFLSKITKKDKNIIIKYLDYKTPTGVIIYGDKVATLVWNKIPTAFVIQSKQTADSYRNFFNDMWKIAKN